MEISKELQRWKQAAKAQDALVKKLEELQKKFFDLSAKHDGIITEKLRAETVKEQSVSNYATDAISQEGLAKARSEYERAVKAHDESAEILSALDKELQMLRSQIRPEVIRSAEKEVWRAIFNELSAEINILIGDRLLKAEAALRLIGHGFIWSDTLVNMLGKEKGVKALNPVVDQMKKDIFK